MIHEKGDLRYNLSHRSSQQGDPKILKLLPAVEPMYAMYPRLLNALGRTDLVLI